VAEQIPPTRSLSEIENDLFTEIAGRTPFTNFNLGAGIRHLLEILAKAIYDLYSLLATVTSQSWVTTATGKWLDLKVREVGIQRRAAVKTQLRLTFRTSVPAGSDITIPIGTICKSRKDSQGNEYRFLTTDTGLIEEGSIEATVLAEAELPGKAWNVAVGTITRIVTKINGIASVSNDEPLVREGADGESDDTLRRRAILTWETLGLGGTRKAYQAWAMAIAGVRAVSILDDFPFGPGTVGVVILGEEGVPSPQLLFDVQTHIDARKPLTADVRVIAPLLVESTIALTITHFADADPVALDTTIRAKIDGFSGALELGESLVRARLVQQVMEIPGVYTDRSLRIAERDEQAQVLLQEEARTQVGNGNLRSYTLIAEWDKPALIDLEEIVGYQVRVIELDDGMTDPPSSPSVQAFTSSGSYATLVKAVNDVATPRRQKVEQVDVEDSVASGSTASVIAYTKPESSFKVNARVLVDGLSRVIRSVDPVAKTITLNQALPSAPISGKTIHSFAVTYESDVTSERFLMPVAAGKRYVLFLRSLSEYGLVSDWTLGVVVRTDDLPVAGGQTLNDIALEEGRLRVSLQTVQRDQLTADWNEQLFSMQRVIAATPTREEFVALQSEILTGENYNPAS